MEHKKIAAHALNLYYGENHALKNINIDIKEKARDLDLDVKGVDPTVEGAATGKATDDYDAGAASDDDNSNDDHTDNIIADIGSMTDVDADNPDNGVE